MIKVVFVGDSPSKFNVSRRIAFVGAKCFNRLAGWIAKIKPDYYICINSYSSEDIYQISLLESSGFKVVALGNVTSERLKDIKVEHFKLPHPSGINRKNNDSVYIAAELCRAYDYVRGS